MTSNLERAQAASLAVDLPGVDAVPVALDRHDARSLVDWTRCERVTGLASLATDREVVQLPGEQVDELQLAHLDALRAALAAEAAAAETTEILRSAGIDCRLIKGVATAHLDHPTPGLRTFNDTDVLVSRTDHPVAIRLLEAAGYVRQEPGLSPRWERRFARAVVLHSPGGVEVDLHTRIATGYFGERVSSSTLFASGEQFTIGGVACTALDGPLRLLTSCYAAEISRGPQLRLVRDVAQQLLCGDIDWSSSTSTAAAADGHAVVARAFMRVQRVLTPELSHPAFDWASRVTPAGLAARALELVDEGGRTGFRADARSTLLALGPADSLRYLAGLAVPPKANRSARGRSPMGQARAVGDAVLDQVRRRQEARAPASSGRAPVPHDL